jgi:hypothetical protein
VNIETGEFYKVSHKTKGEFVLAVRLTGTIFTTGMIVAGKANASEKKNEKGVGEQTTVRNSFCEFELITGPEIDNDEKFYSLLKKERKGIMKLFITYELHGSTKITETDEICRVRDGFWIDDSGEICFSNNAQKYIMPHMIKEIRIEN